MEKMTSNQPLHNSEQALVLRMATQSTMFARRMVQHLQATVPFYAHLPQEQLEGDILMICQHNIEMLINMIATGRDPNEPDLDAIRVSAARRAEEGVPLEAVLSAYHAGLMMMWEHFQYEESVEGSNDLLPLATLMMRYIEQTTTAVANAYLEEHDVIHGSERDGRRALIAALLAGERSADLVALAGVRLAAEYLVLAMDMGQSLDEDHPEVVSTVATRRKIRRMDACVRSLVGTDALTLLDVTGGMVLIPVDPNNVDAVTRDITGLVEALADAAGSSIVAGYAWHPGVAGVATSASEAKVLARLASRLGRRPGAYRLTDLALEYALSRDLSSLGILADILRPVIEHGTGLIQTLETYFDSQLDRRQAAAQLHVHPNTIDYRLRRIHALTGLDAGTASGITMLKVALLAVKIQEIELADPVDLNSSRP